MTERDTFREETRDLNRMKQILLSEKQIQFNAFKEKNSKMETVVAALKADINTLKESMENEMRANRLVTEEREKLKVRIIRLIAKKGNFQQGIKTCKNCTNEYNEKENYNWSCRNHQSEWGGEMWWCCGKRGKEQPGCKYSKHESKDEDEDDKKQRAEDQDKM